MHRTYTSKTDGVSELRRGSEHDIPPLIRKLFASDTCWHLGKWVLSIRMFINWVCQPHLRTGIRSKAVGKHKMKSVFIWFCGFFLLFHSFWDLLICLTCFVLIFVLFCFVEKREKEHKVGCEKNLWEVDGGELIKLYHIKFCCKLKIVFLFPNLPTKD